MTKVLEVIAKVRKAIVVGIGAAIVVFGADAPVLVDVVAVLTALGVYVVPNAE